MVFFCHKLNYVATIKIILPIFQSGYSGAAMDFSSESEMLEGRYKPAVDMNKHFDPSERLSEQYIPRAPSHDEPPSYTTAGSVNLNKDDYLKTTFDIYLKLELVCCESQD